MSKIVKILKVKDTRQYQEEPDGRFYPIPGSGSEHECDRCGRIHEVHATVLTDDGQTLTVGTGCMLAESTEIARALLRLDHAAKRLAEYRALVASMLAYGAAYDQARYDVETHNHPTITRETATPETFPYAYVTFKPDRPGHIYRCGDAIYYGDDVYWDSGHRQQVLFAWQRKRMIERGFSAGHSPAEYRNGHNLRYYQNQIKRLEQALKELTP